VKLILSVCLIALLQIQLAELFHNLGMQLEQLGNLPHRSLGFLYVSTVLQPHRQDWKLDYMAHWCIVSAQDRMIEGQRYPVIPFEAITLSKFYPNDKRAYFIAGLAKRIVKEQRLKPTIEQVK
jgi:hypothetical protein